MAVKDVHPDLETKFRSIAEDYSDTLGPVSDRFVNEAVMLARELENQSDVSVIDNKARELVRNRYASVSLTVRDAIADEIILAVVRQRARLVSH